MKQFEVTMTAVSKKTFKVQAETQDEAFTLVDAILDNTNLLEFTDEEVDNMEITCEEQCGGVCEICSRACEVCGDCTDLEPYCDDPDRECEHRCPVCGACRAVNECD